MGLRGSGRTLVTDFSASAWGTGPLPLPPERSRPELGLLPLILGPRSVCCAELGGWQFEPGFGRVSDGSEGQLPNPTARWRVSSLLLRDNSPLCTVT